MLKCLRVSSLRIITICLEVYTVETESTAVDLEKTFDSPHLSHEAKCPHCGGCVFNLIEVETWLPAFVEVCPSSRVTLEMSDERKKEQWSNNSEGTSLGLWETS